MYTIHQQQQVRRPEKTERETIHSGHFMVSHFEAEEQDDEDNVAVPIPDTADTKSIVPLVVSCTPKNVQIKTASQQLAIDTSLSKLFQCMSLAYRQKLTSPKWNRFRGIRLRWKDKIRLNNVIWRCWHLQFIKKENTLVCQFASPLEVDTHNKPEAVVLEGKYWKRKLAAVTAEYKRWRMFYRNKILGHMPKDMSDMFIERDLLSWDSKSTENMSMMVDEDYMGLMSDTLFSSIANQPFVFPDPREIAKAGLADFIQPSLGPLQPNLDDYMDTFDPIQALVESRLPTVPEENQNTQSAVEWGYMENSLAGNGNLEVSSMSSAQMSAYQMSQLQQMSMDKQVPIQDTRQQQILAQPNFSTMMLPNYVTEDPPPPPPPPYSAVIPKNSAKAAKSSSKGKLPTYSKAIDSLYMNYPQASDINVQVVDRLQANFSQVQQQQTAADIQQQQIQQTLEQYKLVQAAAQDAVRQQQAYKFPVPGAPQIKFTQQQQQTQQQQVQQQQMQMHTGGYVRSSSYCGAGSGSGLQHGIVKEEISEPKRRGAPRGRGRSRSNTREGSKKPPLLTAASDSSLLTPQTSVLLTQLLTNSSDSSNTLFNHPRTLSQSQQELMTKQVRIKEESPGSFAHSSSSSMTMTPQLSISPDPSSSDPLLLHNFSESNSPVMDPLSQSVHSPTSSHSSVGSPTTESNLRDRRSGHIHAEQKRRYNIKNGFDMIHSLIPHLQQNPNAKLSKAAMLQKGAEYIRQLKAERSQLNEEMECLRQQIETLNTSISNCQSLLPATGAPVSRRADCKMQEKFDEYVRMRTMENWKFWIFSLIFRPLLCSFNTSVSTSSLDDLYSSTMHWVEQHCTLPDLRTVVLNSLRYLCTKTEILSEPDKLPDEARQIVLEANRNKTN